MMAAIDDLDVECELYELPKSACTHCHPPVREPVSTTVTNRFKARYDGTAACGHSIYEGDSVAYNSDDQLLCEDCSR